MSGRKCSSSSSSSCAAGSSACSLGLSIEQGIQLAAAAILQQEVEVCVCTHGGGAWRQVETDGQVGRWAKDNAVQVAGNDAKAAPGAARQHILAVAARTALLPHAAGGWRPGLLLVLAARQAGK
jgi:hypothetical protein